MCQSWCRRLSFFPPQSRSCVIQWFYYRGLKKSWIIVWCRRSIYVQYFRGEYIERKWKKGQDDEKKNRLIIDQIKKDYPVLGVVVVFVLCGEIERNPSEKEISLFVLIILIEKIYPDPTRKMRLRGRSGFWQIEMSLFFFFFLLSLFKFTTPEIFIRVLIYGIVFFLDIWKDKWNIITTSRRLYTKRSQWSSRLIKYCCSFYTGCFLLGEGCVEYNNIVLDLFRIHLCIIV